MRPCVASGTRFLSMSPHGEIAVPMRGKLSAGSRLSSVRTSTGFIVLSRDALKLAIRAALWTRRAVVYGGTRSYRPYTGGQIHGGSDMLIHRLLIARLAIVLIAIAGFAGATPTRAAVEIQWWHAMGGELGEKLEKLATDFNAAQSDFKVIPVFKGSYPEAMTGAIAAFRARQHPAML